MKSKLYILSLVILVLACKEKKGDPRSPGDGPTAPDNRPDATTGDPRSNPDNSVLGEWYQQYAVLDQNGNALLETEERNGTRSTMGFNYFQFNKDGACLYDSDMKFKGTYQIIEETGKRKLNITVNGFGETYKHTIIDPVKDELILYSSGAFMIFKKK